MAPSIESVFTSRRTPKDESSSTVLNNSCSALCSCMNDKSMELTKKVEVLANVWTDLLETLERKDAIDKMTCFVEFICQMSLQIVLNAEWENVTADSKESILKSIKGCLIHLNENTEIEDCVKTLDNLCKIFDSPWTISFLDKMFNGQDVETEEVRKYFVEEKGDCFIERIKTLCVSGCEDLALKLVVCCYSVAETPHKDLLMVIHLLLLHKLNQATLLCTHLENSHAEDLVSLVDNLEKLTTLGDICPEFSNLFSFCGILFTQVVKTLTEKLVESKLLHSYFQKSCALWMKHILFKAKLNERRSMYQALAELAPTTTNLYILGEELSKHFVPADKCSCIEMWMVILTVNANEMEILSEKTDKIESANHLANGFLRMAEIVQGCDSIVKECLLSAFSLYPGQDTLEKIKLNVGKDRKQDEKKGDTSGEDILWSEGESIGLSQEMCDDLIILLHSQNRIRSLTTTDYWSDLEPVCQKYITTYNTQFDEVKLEYLKIDYSQFDDMPESDVDEFEGIEKGYEGYLAEKYQPTKSAKEVVKELRFLSEKKKKKKKKKDKKDEKEEEKISKKSKKSEKSEHSKSSSKHEKKNSSGLKVMYPKKMENIDLSCQKSVAAVMKLKKPSPSIHSVKGGRIEKNKHLQETTLKDRNLSYKFERYISQKPLEKNEAIQLKFPESSFKYINLHKSSDVSVNAKNEFGNLKFPWGYYPFKEIKFQKKRESTESTCDDIQEMASYNKQLERKTERHFVSWVSFERKDYSPTSTDNEADLETLLSYKLKNTSL